MSIYTVILDTVQHHAIAGLAGGVVRWLHDGGDGQKVVTAAATGVFSALYMTPLIIWAISYHFELDDSATLDLWQEAGMFIGFTLGLAGAGVVMWVDRLASMFFRSKNAKN